MEKTKIILADAQPVFREGLKNIIESHEDLAIIYEAGNTKDVVRAIEVNQPDILILDFNPTYFDAEELTTVLATQPNCKVIIISSQQQKWSIYKTLQFNIYCYLTKECGIKDIHKAIRSTSRGEKFFCTFIVDILLGDKNKRQNSEKHIVCCLTEREKEITRLVALGKVNKEIAFELNLSPHTIHTHRKNIMKKLGLHSAVELSNFAKETGIIND